MTQGSDHDGDKLLIVHEAGDVRDRLTGALDPAFSVTAVPGLGDVPAEPFDVYVHSSEAHERTLELTDPVLEARAVELDQQRRLLADANRTLKRQQQQLSVAKTRLEEANEKLRRFASTDGLTGLYNHRYFKVTWRRELTRARRYGEELSVMLLDIDHFKGLNDEHGHPEADVILRELGQVLLRSVRSVDLVARYGGDEFVVSLPRTGKQPALMLAERLRGWVEGHDFPFAGTLPGGRVTVSIGVAGYPDDGDTASVILSRADRALYRAKDLGRNSVCGADPSEAVSTEPRDTLDSEEFEALVTLPSEE